MPDLNSVPNLLGSLRASEDLHISGSRRYRRHANSPAGFIRSRIGALFIPVSDRSALLYPRRLRGIEPPVALFDAASPLVSGDGDADMVRPGPLACSGDLLLGLAVCQGKHLIAEGR